MGEIVVIGGGASGMAAAIMAARRGASVSILEHNDVLGKKILSTGNGRCNLTNLDLQHEHYRGDNPELIRTFLKEFDADAALEFFSSIGIYTKCRGGYVYPLCDQAAAVREAFTMEVKRLGVQVRTNCHAEEIRKVKKGFLILCTGETNPYRASKVILSAGGQASEISGSDGSGYMLAKRLGHSLSPVVPALVQLVSEKKCFRKLSGIRITAGISLYVNGELIANDFGEVQLTDYGVSGIPVFQVSRFASKALQQKKKVCAELDFIPQISEDVLHLELLKRRRRSGKYTAAELLNTLFPSKLIPVLLTEAEIDRQVWAEKLSDEKLAKLAHVCKRFHVPVTETKPFSKAQICAGGVKTDEICPETMESRLVEGLYITGELLDVDGICGGYNLHFAWGSGIMAGNDAAGNVRHSIN